jgi:hypothetical protein
LLRRRPVAARGTGCGGGRMGGGVLVHPTGWIIKGACRKGTWLAAKGLRLFLPA